MQKHLLIKLDSRTRRILDTLARQRDQSRAAVIRVLIRSAAIEPTEQARLDKSVEREPTNAPD